MKKVTGCPCCAGFGEVVTHIYPTNEWGVPDCDTGPCLTCGGSGKQPADGKLDDGTTLDHWACGPCGVRLDCNSCTEDMGGSSPDGDPCEHMSWCADCLASFGCDDCDTERRERLATYDTEPPF